MYGGAPLGESYSSNVLFKLTLPDFINQINENSTPVPHFTTFEQHKSHHTHSSSRRKSKRTHSRRKTHDLHDTGIQSANVPGERRRRHHRITSPALNSNVSPEKDNFMNSIPISHMKNTRDKRLSDINKFNSLERKQVVISLPQQNPYNKSLLKESSSGDKNSDLDSITISEFSPSQNLKPITLDEISEFDTLPMHSSTARFENINNENDNDKHNNEDEIITMIRKADKNEDTSSEWSDTDELRTMKFDEFEEDEDEEDDLSIDMLDINNDNNEDHIFKGEISPLEDLKSNSSSSSSSSSSKNNSSEESIKNISLLDKYSETKHQQQQQTKSELDKIINDNNEDTSPQQNVKDSEAIIKDLKKFITDDNSSISSNTSTPQTLDSIASADIDKMLELIQPSDFNNVNTEKHIIPIKPKFGFNTIPNKNISSMKKTQSTISNDLNNLISNNTNNDLTDNMFSSEGIKTNYTSYSGENSDELLQQVKSIEQSDIERLMNMLHSSGIRSSDDPIDNLIPPALIDNENIITNNNNNIKNVKIDMDNVKKQNQNKQFIRTNSKVSMQLNSIIKQNGGDDNVLDDSGISSGLSSIDYNTQDGDDDELQTDIQKLMGMVKNIDMEMGMINEDESDKNNVRTIPKPPLPKNTNNKMKELRNKNENDAKEEQKKSQTIPKLPSKFEYKQEETIPMLPQQNNNTTEEPKKSEEIPKLPSKSEDIQKEETIPMLLPQKSEIRDQEIRSTEEPKKSEEIPKLSSKFEDKQKEETISKLPPKIEVPKDEPKKSETIPKLPPKSEDKQKEETIPELPQQNDKPTEEPKKSETIPKLPQKTEDESKEINAKSPQTENEIQPTKEEPQKSETVQTVPPKAEDQKPTEKTQKSESVPKLPPKEEVNKPAEEPKKSEVSMKPLPPKEETVPKLPQKPDAKQTEETTVNSSKQQKSESQMPAEEPKKSEVIVKPETKPTEESVPKLPPKVEISKPSEEPKKSEVIPKLPPKPEAKPCDEAAAKPLPPKETVPKLPPKVEISKPSEAPKKTEFVKSPVAISLPSNNASYKSSQPNFNIKRQQLKPNGNANKSQPNFNISNANNIKTVSLSLQSNTESELIDEFSSAVGIDTSQLLQFQRKALSRKLLRLQTLQRTNSEKYEKVISLLNNEENNRKNIYIYGKCLCNGAKVIIRFDSCDDCESVRNVIMEKCKCSRVWIGNEQKKEELNEETFVLAVSKVKGKVMQHINFVTMK
ncbi:twitchin isoform X21 [Histomonas meleagridis]|uniref:twitchin isoform X21 n=1 Tax=Histomonas meleagridis TaxID=135588 RepID=UPI00355A3C4B|nr:twitchin isoform X21 [Histomonas meleagridis]KAH0798220.1 twitchin isoform X21 [Histomonas meleagridis]